MMQNWILPSFTLWKRELTRFFRQRNRVVGALGSPLVFWILIGGGLSSSFHPPSMPQGISAIEYLFPGTMTLILLFTSIFSTISIIEDRREGFLQSVLVSPIAQSSIVAGKVFGGATIALIQGILFLFLAPFGGIKLSLISIGLSIGVIFLIAFALTGLGFVLAWKMDSTQGFHAVMNLFLIPMWLLSGSFFPSEGAPIWLKWIMQINPLTYGVAALRKTLYWSQPSLMPNQPSILFPVGITLLFALTFFVLSVILVRKETHL